MELTARNWRYVWEQLRGAGETHLSGRISGALDRIWNGGDWDERVAIDIAGEDLHVVRQAARQAGLDLSGYQ